MSGRGPGEQGEGRMSLSLSPPQHKSYISAVSSHSTWAVHTSRDGENELFLRFQEKIGSF